MQSLKEDQQIVVPVMHDVIELEHINVNKGIPFTNSTEHRGDPYPAPIIRVELTKTQPKKTHKKKVHVCMLPWSARSLERQVVQLLEFSFGSRFKDQGGRV